MGNFCLLKYKYLIAFKSMESEGNGSSSNQFKSNLSLSPWVNGNEPHRRLRHSTVADLGTGGDSSSGVNSYISCMFSVTIWDFRDSELRPKGLSAQATPNIMSYCT